MQKINIRKAIENDLSSILNIKNYFILKSDTTWIEIPLNAPDILLWWKEHQNPRYPIYVAINNMNELIGYSSLSQFRSNDGYRHTVESSIYLLEGYEGKGIAADLMRAVISDGKANGARVITAWINSTNARSVIFHEKLGFELVGTMKNVGIHRGEVRSVVIMDLEL